LRPAAVLPLPAALLPLAGACASLYAISKSPALAWSAAPPLPLRHSFPEAVAAAALSAAATRPPSARLCTAAERDSQRGRISFGDSQCPSNSFLSTVYETAIGCGRDSVIVNVGANKGYVVAEVLSIFAPQVCIGPVRLGKAIAQSGLAFNAVTGCGICNDCAADPAPSSAESCAGPPARVDIHAFEPVPDNVLMMRTLLAPMLEGAEAVSFTIHAVAVVRDAAAVTTVPFSNCRGGGEGCSIQSAAGEGTVNVPTASLDLWAQRELGASTTIDLLFIDAEGFDPDVLRGADTLLRAGRVRIRVRRVARGHGCGS
jgi:FkbM family methyltransferase